MKLYTFSRLTLSFATFASLSGTAHAQTAQPTPVPAQTPGQGVGKPIVAPEPLFSIGGFNFTGALRSRVEISDWFNAPGFNSNDTFTGNQIRLNGIKTGQSTDFGLDLQETFLTGVGNGTVAPPPLGILGLPGNYRAANGNQDGALTLKQAFVRFKNLGGKGSSLRVGRFEFNDGTETLAKDPTLNFLKTQRISQRLIGTFGFSHTGRAFDGLQYVTPVGKGNLTALAIRPTEGVFQLEGNDNIDAVNVLYGAYTKPMQDAEARLFATYYEDGRGVPKSVKTDNRPLPARLTDGQDIEIYTVGGNYLKTFQAGSGKIDLLAWGALQGGDWGVQDHSANAFALEAGYQPKSSGLKPWFRAGYFRSSGDGNPLDNDHDTFFSMLPTPRLYARFPFFNQMNNEDLMGQVILRPNPKLSIRAEAHRLRLTKAADLWYLGGGAFQDTGFGFAGRPSGGSKNLATLLDLSLDYKLSPRTNIGLYFGHANGGGAIAASYPAGNSANYGFIEISHKF